MNKEAKEHPDYAHFIECMEMIARNSNDGIQIVKQLKSIARELKQVNNLLLDLVSIWIDEIRGKHETFNEC